MTAPSTLKCPCCANRGRVTFDSPDVIEGHKLSRYENCPICKGQTIISTLPLGKAIIAFWKVFEREDKLYKKRRTERLSKEAKTKSRALKKLSPAERKVLGV